MMEKNKKQMKVWLQWARNVLAGSILIALLWLQVDVRDTIKYVQPQVDKEQNNRIDNLEECWDTYDGMTALQRKKIRLFESQISSNKKDITLLDKQIQIILRDIDYNRKRYEEN